MENLSLLNIQSSYLVIASLVACIAGLMRGFAGFGSGMLMAPVFMIFFGSVDAVAIVIMLEMAATILIIRTVTNDIQWKFVSIMGVFAAFFMPIGMWLLVSIDSIILTRAIGAIIAVFVIVLFTGWRYQGIKNTWVTASVGAVSGTMMAASSLGNPIVILYMMTSGDDSTTNRSNITAYFGITLSTLIIFMSYSGLLTLKAFFITLLLLPTFIIFSWIGSKLFNKSNERLNRLIALGFLLCASIVGLVG